MYMNENSQPGFGKISVHGDGVGAPSPEMIERRAREIALIDERDPDDFTDSDWEQAHRELMGIPQVGAPEEALYVLDIESALLSVYEARGIFPPTYTKWVEPAGA